MLITMLKKKSKTKSKARKNHIYLQNQLDIFDVWRNEEIEKRKSDTSRRAECPGSD